MPSWAKISDTLLFSWLSDYLRISFFFLKWWHFSGGKHFRPLFVPNLCEALKTWFLVSFSLLKDSGDDLFCGEGGVGVGGKILLQIKGLVYSLSHGCHFDIDRDVYFLDLSWCSWAWYLYDNLLNNLLLRALYPGFGGLSFSKKF